MMKKYETPKYEAPKFSSKTSTIDLTKKPVIDLCKNPQEKKPAENTSTPNCPNPKLDLLVEIKRCIKKLSADIEYSWIKLAASRVEREINQPLKKFIGKDGKLDPSLECAMLTIANAKKDGRSFPFLLHFLLQPYKKYTTI